MKFYILILTLAVNLLMSSTAAATSMLPVTLEQLSTKAVLIFYGEAINSQVKKDEQSGQIATFTEFKIIDLIKGEASETYTIKQIGGFDRKSNTRLFIHGVPQFTDGNKYVVFLPEKSTLGFSSPLGLHQGSFSVISQDGEQIVTNGKNLNAPAATSQNSIQVPLAVRAENEAQTRLDDFLNSVRAFNTH